MNTHTPDDTPRNNDPLERLLRESADRSTLIPDDGFTARVLQALPARRPAAHTSSLRIKLCLAGGIIGLLLSVKSPLGTSTTSTDPLSLMDRFAAALIDASAWLTATAQLTLMGTLALVSAILLLLDERVRRWL